MVDQLTREPADPRDVIRAAVGRMAGQWLPPDGNPAAAAQRIAHAVLGTVWRSLVGILVSLLLLQLFGFSLQSTPAQPDHQLMPWEDGYRPPTRAAIAHAPVTVTVTADPSPAAQAPSPATTADPTAYVPAENVPTTTCEPLPPSGGVAATVNSCGNDIRPGAGSVETEATPSHGPNLLQRILGWAGGMFGWLARLFGVGR